MLPVLCKLYLAIALTSSNILFQIPRLWSQNSFVCSSVNMESCVQKFSSQLFQAASFVCTDWFYLPYGIFLEDVTRFEFLTNERNNRLAFEGNKTAW